MSLVARPCEWPRLPHIVQYAFKSHGASLAPEGDTLQSNPNSLIGKRGVQQTGELPIPLDDQSIESLIAR